MKIAITIFLGILLSACAGVSYSFRGGEIPGETFSVESFALGPKLSLVNPDLPIVLQDALQQKFTNESNLKFTDMNADARFKGTISKYTITPVQGTGNEVVSLNRLTISLKINYMNSKDAKIDSVAGKTIEVTGFDDFESTADFATEEPKLVESISDKLVSLIFNQVLVDW